MIGQYVKHYFPYHADLEGKLVGGNAKEKLPSYSFAS